MSNNNPSSYSYYVEEEYGKNLDYCVSNAIVKGCGGLIIGTVISCLFLRRRVWPVWVGAGYGLGVAYRACENQMNAVNWSAKRKGD